MLDSRSGSPLSPPTLARDRWAEHPHYPQHVLLLGSHRSFREVSEMLRDRITELDPADPDAPAIVRAVESIFGRWIRGMRSHERYEEAKLYPYLARRWGVSFEEARAGHAALHRRHDEVCVALDRAHHRIDALSLADARDALDGHDRALRAHLELEEAQVIPLLLHLSPPEFEELITYPLPVLMRRMDRRDGLGSDPRQSSV